MAAHLGNMQLAAPIKSDFESLGENLQTVSEKQTLPSIKREASLEGNGSTVTKRLKITITAGLKVKEPHEDEIEEDHTPIVWSESRQALCDATPYFKSHQGGLHTKNNVALGLLIDGAGHTIRDKFGAEVIITTMGGGRKLDDNGNYTREANHVPSTKHIWEKTRGIYHPIVIVAGNNHPDFPCRTIHRYSVLDSFWITDIWTERYEDDDGSLIQVYKVRLEKVHLGQRSWWWDAKSVNACKTLGPRYVGQHTPIKIKCENCHHESKQIFAESWTCLNSVCKKHFVFPEEVDSQTLTYSEAFLGERTVFPRNVANLAKIFPDLPSHDVISSTSVGARAGVVCPVCGCCSRRRYWNRWECEKPGCVFVLHAVLQPHAVEDVEAETKKHQKWSDKHANKGRKDANQSGHLLDDVTIVLDKTIIMEKHNIGSYKASIYVLPNEAGEALGCVVVYRANKAICERAGGPNDLYRDLQNVDLGLQRNPARCGEAWNEVLTRHFQQNFGAPYKFGVTVTSKSFEDAPEPILKCLARLQWAGQTTVKASGSLLTRLEKVGSVKIGDDLPPRNGWTDFNELLALGYMEKDEINFHDDGEKQLGPTVATMSLGSPSKMSFRPKKRSKIASARGKKGKNLERPNPNAEYEDVLTVRLMHGDMVVMHGAAIHRDYEHAVDPLGQRRYALTSRVIRESAIPPADREVALRMGTLPDNYSSFEYDGDIQTDEQAAALLTFTDASETAGHTNQ